MIKIEHSSVYKLTKKQWDFLLRGNKLSSYLNNMNKIIDEVKKTNPFIDIPKLEGDLYEIFVEAFIKFQPLKFKDYHPNEILDYGVDGSGIGADGLPFTQQSKKRPTNELLKFNDAKISNFVLQSIHDFNVNPNTKTNLVIFTTGAGLHHSIKKGIPSITQNMIILNCYNFQNQRKLVDNNEIFWLGFRESINDKFSK